jgi:hypothetical protein
MCVLSAGLRWISTFAGPSLLSSHRGNEDAAISVAASLDDVEKNQKRSIGMKKVLFSVVLASFAVSPLLALAAPTPVSAEEGKDAKKKDKKKDDKKDEKKGEEKK